MIKKILFNDEVEIGISEIKDGNMRLLETENVTEPDIQKNQEKLCDLINLVAKETARIRTVYGERNTFTKYDEITNENLNEYTINNSEKLIPITDGLITKCLNVGILLPLADCLGVVVFDEKQRILGLLHSGRQNIEQHGPEKFVRTFIENHHSDPKNLRIYFSPYALDYKIYSLENKSLSEATVEQLTNAGVLKENILDEKIDTVSNENFPSNSHGDKNFRFAIVVKQS